MQAITPVSVVSHYRRFDVELQTSRTKEQVCARVRARVCTCAGETDAFPERGNLSTSWLGPRELEPV